MGDASDEFRQMNICSSPPVMEHRYLELSAEGTARGAVRRRSTRPFRVLCQSGSTSWARMGAGGGCLSLFPLGKKWQKASGSKPVAFAHHQYHGNILCVGLRPATAMLLHTWVDGIMEGVPNRNRNPGKPSAGPICNSCDPVLAMRNSGHRVLLGLQCNSWAEGVEPVSTAFLLNSLTFKCKRTSNSFLSLHHLSLLSFLEVAPLFRLEILEGLCLLFPWGLRVPPACRSANGPLTTLSPYCLSVHVSTPTSKHSVTTHNCSPHC